MGSFRYFLRVRKRKGYINHMVFSSLIFVFWFLPLVLAIYYISPNNSRNYLLAIISLMFYAYGEPKFVLIMMASILINFVVAIKMERTDKTVKTGVFLLGVMVNVLLLFICKYLNFSINLLDRFLGLSIPQTKITLPVGISFFTFQQLSYIIDVYIGQTTAQRSIVNYALYVSFFPQLIAGPIVRYVDIKNEIVSRYHKWDQICDGVKLFIIGFCKKVLLANNLSLVADYLWQKLADADNGISLSVAAVWMGTICFSLQIYYDFSGYSDMAIGLGQMFGFHFPENFRYPYISKTITEFWRRWHMTLSGWFRDYVYIPLGGSHYGNMRTICNLFIVWILTGLWHGADYNFVIWGVSYFLILILEKFLIKPERFKHEWLRCVYRIFTLLFINCLWILFKCTGEMGGLMQCIAIYKIMFGFSGNELINNTNIFLMNMYGVFFFVGLFFATPILLLIKRKMKSWEMMVVYGAIETILLMAGFVLGVSYLVMGANNPFIYFNF